MPFKDVGQNDNVSPSGRHFSDAQVRLYYATNGFKDKPKGKGKKARGKSNPVRRVMGR